MAKRHPTIICKVNGVYRKLLKVWFGSDGSFYVAPCYHSARTAYAFKHQVVYDTGFAESRMAFQDEFVDDGTLDDNEGTLKLSHHPSGLVQFSGRGVLSGPDGKGGALGIGVQSRALMAIGDGPAWGFAAYGFDDFDQTDIPKHGDIVATFDDLAPSEVPAPWPDPENPLPLSEGITVEGYYFQPKYRKFVTKDASGNYVVSRIHPSGMILPLKVILSPPDCDLPGFLGLDFYRRYTGNTDQTSGFALNGPGGDTREDPMGNMTSTNLACFFPRPTNMKARRDLSYPPKNNEKEQANPADKDSAAITNPMEQAPIDEQPPSP